MSLPLFKVNIKSTWVVVTSVTFFVMIYVAAAIAMYDPSSAEKMQQMFEMLPEGFLKAFGFDKLGSEFTPYLSNYLYGFIMLLFPLIGSTVLANMLVAKHVDSGSMAYLLATPNTRIKIITTQAIYLIVSVLVIFLVNVGFGLVYAAASYKGLLDVSAFMQLNLVAILVALAVGGISFFASCAFDDSKVALGVGAGIPALMFLARILTNMSEDLAFMRNFSVYTLIDVERILSELDE